MAAAVAELGRVSNRSSSAKTHVAAAEADPAAEDAAEDAVTAAEDAATAAVVPAAAAVAAADERAAEETAAEDAGAAALINVSVICGNLGLTSRRRVLQRQSWQAGPRRQC